MNLDRQITEALGSTGRKKTLGRAQTSAPWFSDYLGRVKADCKHWERQWRKDYSDQGRREYKEALKSYHGLIRRAKAAYIWRELGWWATLHGNCLRSKRRYPPHLRPLLRLWAQKSYAIV